MTNPSAQTMLERSWIVDLIRNTYDQAPSHYKKGDDWDDGAETIADIIIARAASAPAAVREVLQDQVNRIHGAISDYSDMLPESDETWESWYRAAFDLLSQKVKVATDKIMSVALATPEEASTEPTRDQLQEWAASWHQAAETIMTLAGLSCSLSPSESVVEFQKWLLVRQEASTAAGEADGLHPATAALVRDFADALAKKLRAAEIKYGHLIGWRDDDWEDECKRDLIKHVMKGDPLDVAAFAAFCWKRGWSTTPHNPDHEEAFLPIFERWADSMLIGEPDREILRNDVRAAPPAAQTDGVSAVAQSIPQETAP